VITVLLYGELGKLYGKRHVYAINSVAEALQALNANFKGFTNSIKASGHYRVIVDKKHISEDQLTRKVVESIKIVPVIQGSSKGIGQIIVGIALIWASGGFAAAGYGGLAAGSTGWAAVAWKAVGAIGSALVMGGVTQMLTKTPKQAAGADRPDNKPSYSFDGPVNTTAQGNPVPLAYGKILAGSQVISAGLEVR
jgi:predicted phage tail protein